MNAPQPNLIGWGPAHLPTGCVRDSGGGTIAEKRILAETSKRTECRSSQKEVGRRRMKYRNPVLIRNRSESRRFFEKLARDRQVV